MGGGNFDFRSLDRFPALWMVGLVGFVALFWYAWRSTDAVRRTFLVLWVPAGVAAGTVFMLGAHGYGVADTVRLLVQRDPATFRLLIALPIDAAVATYAVLVGGTVAALATAGLQLAGVVVGAALSVVTGGPRRG